MKKIIFYFDNKVTKILKEKVDETGEKKSVLSSKYNFVSRSEIIARVVDVDNDDQIPEKIDEGFNYYNVEKFMPIKVGEGILYDQRNGVYRVDNFGFIVFHDGTLQLLSMRSVSRDKIKAYYTIHPSKFGKLPSAADIKEYLHNFKILAGVSEKIINDQLAKIDTEKPKLTRIIVAKGKEPVNGHNEIFLPKIDFEKKAGEELSDGSMDFKEVGSIIQVVKNQEILKRIPQVEPVDGFDIFGNKIPAEMDEKEGYRRGNNIVQSGQDENLFISAIDGCLNVANNKVSVLEVAVIHGDINYETGNIDFRGSVHVSGSVLSGFSIRADADVIVDNIVEDAHIEAGGDITVKMGVVGKESVKLIAGGKINAKYLLNAKIEAKGEIIAEDSIINCNVFSNDKVSVIAKQGKIIGGNIIALYDIIAKVAGAPNETGTSLGVGRNLEIEKELAVVQKEINLKKEEISETTRQLQVNFGEEVFENPKELIKILPAIKKKTCLVMLQELSNSNKNIKELLEKAKVIQAKLKLEREPFITIYNKIYPGVVVNVKKSVKKIEKEQQNVKFYEDSEDKVVRFTSAK